VLFIKYYTAIIYENSECGKWAVSNIQHVALKLFSGSRIRNFTFSGNINIYGDAGERHESVVIKQDNICTAPTTQKNKPTTHKTISLSRKLIS